MQLGTRKLFDRAFTGIGLFSILLMTAALLVFLVPITLRGARAFWFRGTIEYRKLVLDHFGRGDRAEVEREAARAAEARMAVYGPLAAFKAELKKDFSLRLKYRKDLAEFEDALAALLGPAPGRAPPVLVRDRYGQTRWDRAQAKLHDVLYIEEYDHSDPTKMGVKLYTPRVDRFRGTALEPAFAALERGLDGMLLPRRVFYWRFLTDDSFDAHMFGGIWAEVLGTIYLTLGAVLFAVPVGVITAVYLVEYAGESRLVSVLRSFINTLAGVPSIVFGLFGLAFFINSLQVSRSKSVLAGALTLALLVLPTVIRASEEAIRSVPQTYREAALSLGAGKWRTIMTVILPAALPGILTGTILSMGRAAGETAPIIFTAAVSLGKPLHVWQVFSEPTPALPWNIYNLCTEHQAVDEIRHVQYGMVLTLIAIVLLLNVSAVVLRARISRKLKG